MAETPWLAEWSHLECQVGLRAGGPLKQRYEIHHRSGFPMGCASNLAEARTLIDGQILLMRQRLAALA